MFYSENGRAIAPLPSYAKGALDPNDSRERPPLHFSWLGSQALRVGGRPVTINPQKTACIMNGFNSQTDENALEVSDLYLVRK